MVTDLLRPPHTLNLGDWSDLGPAAQVVRRAVFIEEQGIAEAEEWDEDDALALHAVIRDAMGLPLATGRLITAGEPSGRAKIGRMAVLRHHRGAGMGQRILQALVHAARERSIWQLSLHAQTSAQVFYERAGFTPEGPVFDEVGIPHVVMTLRV